MVLMENNVLKWTYLIMGRKSP